MKTSFLTLAAAALLLAGCSKEELTENAAEGVSSVATPTNGNARFGNPNNTPDIWINKNTGRVTVTVKGKGGPLDMEMQIVHQRSAVPGDDPTVIVDGDGLPDPVTNQFTLQRVGNSKIYRSNAGAFTFGAELEFELVDVILDWNFDDSFPLDESRYETQLFLYPSGRAVEQDPKIYFRRGHIQETITGEWDETIAELTIVIADDPAQQVEKVKFVPDPIYPYADDPTYAVYPEPSYLEKTHENTNLGLSRWSGPGRSGAGSSARFEGTIYMIKADGQALETNFAILLD